MANQTFKVKSGLTLNPVDLTTLTAPQAGDLACDINDSNKIKRYDAVSASWKEVGSGGGPGDLDILFQQDFDTAVLGDFTQSGLTLSTTNPLHGTTSAVITHSTLVGRYFQQTVAVDPKFRGQLVTMSFDVESNAQPGNVTLYIEDNNSTVLVNSEQVSIEQGSIVRNTFSFTIPSNATSLIYVIDCLVDFAVPTTKIDDIVIRLSETALLETSVEVPNVTPWQGYTPTFQGFGTPTNVEFEWRQVGENVEIRGKFTAGTPTAVEARIGLPAGLTSAGTSLIPSLQIAGHAIATGASATYFSSEVLIEPSVTYVTLGQQTSSNFATTKVNGTAYSASVVITFTASVPCAGLSATSAKTIPLTQSGLIQEADSRIYAAGNGGQAITSVVTNVTFNPVSSSGSDITFTGTTFSVANSGLYSITGSIRQTTAPASQWVYIYQDGVLYRNLAYAVNMQIIQFGGTLQLNSGSTYSIRLGTTATLQNLVGDHFIDITKQGSLKQVSVITNQKATIPTSELRFEGASTRGSTATAIVRFDTQARLRGDAFSVVSDATNGTAVTMLKAGKLDVSSSLVSASGQAMFISLNQLDLTAIPTGTEALAADGFDAGSTRSSCSWSGHVKAGDVIRVSCSGTPTANTRNSLNLSFQEQSVSVSVTNTLPQFSESDSYIGLNTYNGYGSVANKILRFSNVEENSGSDITYTDSATNGSSFLINSDGEYHISLQFDASSTNAFIGVSRNASNLTTAINALSQNEIVGFIRSGASANYTYNFAKTIKLSKGDIIRPHTDNAVSTNTSFCKFSIAKVGKPNVTGVDVTPFVNVPQPVTHYLGFTTSSNVSPGTITNALTFDNTAGVIRYNQPTGEYIALKRCQVNYTGTARSGSAINMGIRAYKGLVLLMQTYTPSNTSGLTVTGSGSIVLEAGESIYFQIDAVAASTGFTRCEVVAVGLSDTILTAPETFSTDTAALVYAPSSTYTLTTLANAPVGTYITFTYTANNNTRTQTNTRPTQTDADMNTNGIQLTRRVYNTTGSAATPAYVAIQVGKGLKGINVAAYEAANKTTAFYYDHTVVSATEEYGTHVSYNEKTGILVLDAAMGTVANTARGLGLSEAGAGVLTGYFVINASKNPALTGLGLNVVAARGINTAGTSIPNTAYQTLTYDAAKTFDTHGALNAATGFFTAPENGYYNVSGSVGVNSFAGNAGEALTLEIRKNTSTLILSSEMRCQAAITTVFQTHVKDVVYLAKGETISLSVYQNSGGSVPLVAAVGYNILAITKVGV